MLKHSLLLVAGAVAPLGLTGLWVYGTDSVVEPGNSVATLSCCASTDAMSADVAAEVAAEPAIALPEGNATVKGTIKFEGAAPAREAVDMKSDGVCVKANAAPLKEDLIVGKENGLKNVFVYLKKGLEGKFEPSATPVTIDQHGCMYSPHVFGIMAGQKLVVKNSDDTTHNVHSYPKKNKVLNQGQPAKAADITVDMKTAEMNVWVKCDIHSWMTALCHITKNPFFAVTDEAGNFEIKNLPAGKYTFEAIHETLGNQELEIEVKAKETTELKFRAMAKK